MVHRDGELVNETLNAPAYLRRGASRGQLRAKPLQALPAPPKHGLKGAEETALFGQMDSDQIHPE
jgi:hypothetical protein